MSWDECQIQPWLLSNFFDLNDNSYLAGAQQQHIGASREVNLSLMLASLGPSSYAGWHFIDLLLKICDDNKQSLVTFVILAFLCKICITILTLVSVRNSNSIHITEKTVALIK